MAWKGSTRRATLPKDWPNRVRLVRARDRDRCQWPTALHTTDLPHVLAGRTQWPTGDTCGAPGRDVDHKLNRHDHRLVALWTLCGTHHDAKTHAESMASRVPLNRPAERHPGIL